MHEFSYQEHHMGTEVYLSFVCMDASIADAIAAETFATIHDYELQFSRFLPTSELSRLNTQKSLVVSAEFLGVLEKSIALYTLTKHAFNPLVQVHALGYTTSFTTLKDMVTKELSTTYNTDFAEITIDQMTHTIGLGKDQQLDFGGLLKGYLAMKLADHIIAKHRGITGVIVNIGGDVTSRGHDELHKPFIFYLYNPVADEEIPIELTDTSLATSGTYARTWRTSVGPRHHIVDPVSLKNPDADVVAVSIIHRDGAVAEALTKLFLVRGPAEALMTVPPTEHEYTYFTVSSNGEINSNFL